jgi:hypothetical protein
MPVAVQSKASVCGSSIAEFAASNPAVTDDIFL